MRYLLSTFTERNRVPPQATPNLEKNRKTAGGEKLLTEAQVRRKVRISLILLRRWEGQGAFPKRVKLGDTRMGWSESEIDEWIEDRKAARDKARP
jgi:prophage regulatory protein